jgi:hypothetical protein
VLFLAWLAVIGGMLLSPDRHTANRWLVLAGPIFSLWGVLAIRDRQALSRRDPFHRGPGMMAFIGCGGMLLGVVMAAIGLAAWLFPR